MESHSHKRADLYLLVAQAGTELGFVPLVCLALLEQEKHAWVRAFSINLGEIFILQIGELKSSHRLTSQETEMGKQKGDSITKVVLVLVVMRGHEIQHNIFHLINRRVTI